MITTLLAKVREMYGLAPNASLAQVNDAIDESTTPAPTVIEPTDVGADAGAGTVEVPADPPATEATSEEAQPLTTEQVQAMIDTALTAQAQAITDLNVTNAELSARLQVVEGADAAPHTSGRSAAVNITEEVKPLYTQNPINQRAGNRLAGLE